MKWLFLDILVLGGLALLWMYCGRAPPVSDVQRAANRAEQILRACEAYRDHPQNPERGKYPCALADLVHPSFGGPSFLRNGLADLSDPWGNQFDYLVLHNGTGEAEISVWTVRGVDGKRKVIGSKRRADGAIEVFGHEE